MTLPGGPRSPLQPVRNSHSPAARTIDGVRELWRLRGSRKTAVLGVDFLALGKGAAPRKLDASEVLQGLTAADVRDAVQPSRLSMTLDERVEAVARIVRRRQRASIRVREEGATYAASAPAPESPATTD